MGVPKGKRKESRFEAQHHYFRLRSEVTTLMLNDFGFSAEKYNAGIERYRQCHASAENVEEAVERYKRKCEAFHQREKDPDSQIVAYLQIFTDKVFTLGNGKGHQAD